MAAGSTTNQLKLWSHAPKRRRARKKGPGFCWRLIQNASAEKITIGILLMIAWGWIMTTIGMVFYHGYYHRGGSNPGYNSLRKSYLPGFDPPKAPDFQPGRLSSASSSTGGNVLLGGAENDLLPVSEQARVIMQQQNEAGEFVGTRGNSPLLIFTFKRADYLRQTLEDVYKFIPRDCSVGCPVVVSQDGTFGEVIKVVSEFQAKFRELGIPVVHWQHDQSQQFNLRGKDARVHNAKQYAALANHYGWALEKVFSEPPFQDESAHSNYPAPSRVIILEEDLHIAPDFFTYFGAVAPLLDRDQTLLCASAYNDNGLKEHVKDATRIVRSDFFPGLGWMMTRKLWTQELSEKWPEAYWDDWLREPEQRKDRHILRPEVSRTFHFGTQGGASENQFGKTNGGVWLNPDAVDWSHEETDLSYLLPERFDQVYWHLLSSATLVQTADRSMNHINGNVRLEYRDLKHFKRLASSLGLFPDEKAGVPRTAYKGVVETRLDNNQILFLTPPMERLEQDFESAKS